LSTSGSSSTPSTFRARKSGSSRRLRRSGREADGEPLDGSRLVLDLRPDREREREDRLTVAALDGAPPAVRPRDRGDDREAEADAALRACARIVRPGEAVEDAPESVLGHARAFVGDGDDDLAAGRIAAQRDPGA